MRTLGLPTEAETGVTPDAQRLLLGLLAGPIGQDGSLIDGFDEAHAEELQRDMEGKVIRRRKGLEIGLLELTTRRVHPPHDRIQQGYLPVGGAIWVTLHVRMPDGPVAGNEE